MDPDDVRWLATAGAARAGAEATAMLDAAVPLPTLLDRLRRDLGPARASAALALAEGRRALAGKHPLAARLYADRAGAEQAAHHRVAAHTARRFEGVRLVADLGCGIGADTLALAAHAPVLAVDRDPARLAMAEANTAVAGVTEHVHFEQVDLAAWEPPPEVDAVWLDPARRDTEGRRLEPQRWSPPLDRALALASAVPRAGLKVAPGLDFDLLPADAEVECVSLDGSLRAAVAWLGDATGARRRRATVLDEAGSHTLDGEPAAGEDVRPAGRVLYDPDPAVVRAGLVATLAEALDAWLLDPQIAYLAADEPRATPFARRFAVLDAMPFGERRLREALQALGATRVEVMRRGSPVDTNALERRLNGALRGGGEPHTIVLTRVAGAHTALLCRRERDLEGAATTTGRARSGPA